MKRERLLSRFWAAALSFLLGAGTAGCLATAFGFSLSWQVLAMLGGFCVLAALICGFPMGETVGLGLLALAALLLWRRGTLSAELDALVHEITRCYHIGYDWPVLGWIEERDPALTVSLPFLLTGTFIALVTARVVTRRGRSFWAIAAAAPVFTLCVILNDTVPAVPYLMMALFAVVMLLMTQTLRRRQAAQGNRLAGLLALPLALALAALFAAVPQEGYTPPPEDLAQRTVSWFQELELGQELVDRALALISGWNRDMVDLKNSGPRASQKYTVMEVTAESDGLLYLRGRAYDVYDGKSWTASEGEWALDSDYVTRSTFLGNVTVSTQTVHDVRYTPSVSTQSVPVQFYSGYLANPDRLKDYAFPWFLQSDGQLLTQSSYQLSRDGTGDTDIQSGAEALMQELAGQYLALPESTREAAERYLRENMPGMVEKTTVPSRKTMVTTPIAGKQYTLPIYAAGDVILEASLIRELVRTSAAYDLKTKKMPGGQEDFAMWFLESSDTGYCVHFATAATVLLRAAGIPARYVEGYLADARADTAVAVLGEDAHAWVEYWVPGYGWMMLEATPGYGTPVQETTEAAETTVPEDTTEPENLPDGTEAQSATQSSQPDTPDRPDVTRPSASAGETTASTGESPALLPGTDSGKARPDLTWLLPVLKWLASAALVLGGLWAQWKLRLRHRLRRLSRGTPNQQALQYWRELERMWRLLKLPPDDALEQLAQKAKFSQHSLDTAELERFLSCRAELVDALGRRSLPRRLWYRFALALY